MLITDWVTIGTEGFAIDGREISGADLITMAETYDREEYTAVINADHDLDWFGNYGHVYELRHSKDKKGRVILQARLVPNFRMIEMNRNGQRNFSSMEIWRDYAKTGKPYLSGLALVNDPGSLGTTMLKFSAEKKNPKDNKALSAPYSAELKFDSEDEPETFEPVFENGEQNGFITRLAKFFKTDPAFSEKPESHDDEDQETEMSKELLEKISQQQEALTSALSTLAEGINQHFSAGKPEGEEKPEGKKEDTPDPKEPEAVSAERFNQLAEKTDKLVTTVQALSDTFNKLKEEKPGTKFNKNEGDGDKITFV